MNRSKLASDALQIWQAGVDAVKPERCLASAVSVEGDLLRLGDVEVPLSGVGRIAVVGAGKGGAGMVRALEEILGPKLMADKQIDGWVNVPADCLDDSTRIHLHAARPAGVNAPTVDGAAGTKRILEIVSGLDSNDVCIVLISGGGSALLPAPIEGISIDDKIAVAQEVAAAGGNIGQLNTVRRALSQVKGGGLARACNAGLLVALVVSDVPGDALDTIASGPTVASRTTARDALDVLSELGLMDHMRLENVARVLRSGSELAAPLPTCVVEHVMIANNAMAVDSAGIEAERLGYNHAMASANTMEGPAEEIGRHLASMALQMRDYPGPNCLITGGEPTVALPPAELRGRGGRNQQLVLAAMQELGDCRGISILSGGTDGEDGPTDAAGAWADESLVQSAQEQHLAVASFLERCDAYNFFGPLGGLIHTGPTNTNVCDIRVVVVDQSQQL